jgi:hypothetical protein
MLNNLLNTPDHIIRARLLPLLAIDLRRILQLLGIRDRAGKSDSRSNRREAIERFRVPELSAGDGGGDLEVAG